MRPQHLLLTLFLGGCTACGAHQSPDSASQPREPKHAIQIGLKSIPTLDFQGQATLEEKADGVLVELAIDHAAPGPYGVHVYARTDCDVLGSDLRIAGEREEPGRREPEQVVETLGEVQVDEAGHGSLRATLKGASLLPGHARSLLERQLVIYRGGEIENATDEAAGPPVACGEIKEQS